MWLSPTNIETSYESYKNMTRGSSSGLGAAKGSERMIYHPDIDGRPESHPVKCHSENQELRKGVISSIIRRFKLPKDLL